MVLYRRRCQSDPSGSALVFAFLGYPDYLVGMRERKVADKLNPQRISWLMARSVRSLAREQILHQTGDAQDQQQ